MQTPSKLLYLESLQILGSRPHEGVLKIKEFCTFLFDRNITVHQDPSCAIFWNLFLLQFQLFLHHLAQPDARTFWIWRWFVSITYFIQYLLVSAGFVGHLEYLNFSSAKVLSNSCPFSGLLLLILMLSLVSSTGSTEGWLKSVSFHKVKQILLNLKI